MLSYFIVSDNGTSLKKPLTFPCLPAEHFTRACPGHRGPKSPNFGGGEAEEDGGGPRQDGRGEEAAHPEEPCFNEGAFQNSAAKVGKVTLFHC